MIIKNRALIQSYVVTTAKYDFSVFEKRILYRIVEILQSELEGKKLRYKYRIEKNLWNDRKFAIPVKLFLIDDKDKNHYQIKKALKSLENKMFEYEDDKVWQTIRIIYKPKINKTGEYVTFEIVPEIYNALLDFSKGFRKYELKVSMGFDSVYAMRFYELLSGKKESIVYSIDDIKEMFKIENKYKYIKDFRLRVLDMAKKELDKCSPYSFEYEFHKTGRKFTHITFYPIFQPQFRDEDLEGKRLNHLSHASRWKIEPPLRNFLKTDFEFTDKELNNNIDLIKNAFESIDLSEFIDEVTKLKPRALRANNPKGYLIGAFKKMVKKAGITESAGELERKKNFEKEKEKAKMLEMQLAKQFSINK